MLLAAHPEIVSLAPLSFLFEEKRGLFLLIGGAHLILVQGPFPLPPTKDGERVERRPFILFFWQGHNAHCTCASIRTIVLKTERLSLRDFCHPYSCAAIEKSIQTQAVFPREPNRGGCDKMQLGSVALPPRGLLGWDPFYLRWTEQKNGSPTQHCPPMRTA